MDRGMIGLLPFAFIPDNRSNAFVATAAGLATIGFNGVALTPEYGARQRFICLLTDLDLAADEMIDFDPGCADCRQCLTACPTGALHAEKQTNFVVGGRAIQLPELDALRCDWSKRFGLVGEAGPALMGSTTDVPPPKVISLASIADAMEQRDHLQDHFASIVEPCIRVCPARGRPQTSVSRL
jgi:ferredoxin